MAKDKGKKNGKDRKDPEKGDLKKLRKLIKGARVAMLTTVGPDGTLRSRPMATLKAPFEGDVWFFTRATAPKADEIRDNDHVNVSYADHNGVAHAQTSVPLYDRAQTPQDAHGKEWYAVWMEYQFNQALRALEPTQAPQVGAGRPVDVQLRQLPEGA